LESLAVELASVDVSEKSRCTGLSAMSMCSVLLEREAEGLKHMEGKESGKRLARGAPVAVRSRVT
jgi:hypothetical protein